LGLFNVSQMQSHARSLRGRAVKLSMSAQTKINLVALPKPSTFPPDEKA
jgi:hypothetical protein